MLTTHTAFVNKIPENQQLGQMCAWFGEWHSDMEYTSVYCIWHNLWYLTSQPEMAHHLLLLTSTPHLVVPVRISLWHGKRPYQGGASALGLWTGCCWVAGQNKMSSALCGCPESSGWFPGNNEQQLLLRYLFFKTHVPKISCSGETENSPLPLIKYRMVLS